MRLVFGMSLSSFMNLPSGKSLSYMFLFDSGVVFCLCGLVAVRRLAPVVFVLYLFLSFSTLFFFIMILFNPTSSYLWLNKNLSF